MHITTTELESSHLPELARLLAARHRRDRMRQPLLPPGFEEPAACRDQIADALGESGAFGAVALAGGDVTGFMIMSPLIFGPADMTAAFFAPRPAQVGGGGHAAREDVVFDAYREMYARVSEHFVQRGYFDHVVYVSPDDAAVNEAFVSLGFGRAVTEGIRGVDPVDGGVAGVEVHLAGAEDLSVLMALGDELLAHHAASPIYWPHLREPLPALEDFQRQLLEGPRNACFVAYQGGKPVGMNTFMPPDWVAPMLRPDNTVYLYTGVVSGDARGGGVGKAILARGAEWAREEGYEHIALHYASPNISGARFWEGQGFRPIEYRLVRHIDERIAWAGKRAASV
jgi:GNAT superfamily N-acetyltransferase